MGGGLPLLLLKVLCLHGPCCLEPYWWGGLCCHQRLWWCLDPCCQWGHDWVHGPIVDGICVDVTTEGHVDIYSLCCSLRPCWCLRAMLQLRAILMWMACAATQRRCWCLWLDCLQGPCLSPWSSWSQGPYLSSVLLPETMWKPIILAPTDCEVQGGYFCCDMDDYRCTVEREGHGRLLWQPLPPITPLPPQSNS